MLKKVMTVRSVRSWIIVNKRKREMEIKCGVDKHIPLIKLAIKTFSCLHHFDS